MNVNRIETDSDDANAELIARMDALIERSSLGTEGARSLRNRTSRERRNRIKKLIAQREAGIDGNAAVLDQRPFERQAPQIAADIGGADLLPITKPLVYRLDLNRPFSRYEPAYSKLEVDEGRDFVDLPTSPYEPDDDVFDLILKYSTAPHGRQTGKLIQLWNLALTETRGREDRIKRILARYWTDGDGPHSRALFAEPAALPWTEVDCYTSRDVFHTSTRILSMRLPFGRMNNHVDFPSESDASAIAEHVQLWFLTDRLTRPPRFFQSRADTLAWLVDFKLPEEEKHPLMTCLSAIDSAITDRDLPRSVPKTLLDERIVHRVSVIMDARDIERSRSILESILTSHRFHLDVGKRCSFDFGLKFLSESQAIGAELPRSVLNRLLRIMVDRWRLPAEIDGVAMAKINLLEAVLITSTSRYEGFLSSAFDAIDSASRDPAAQDHPPEQEFLGKLRHVAAAFAAELDRTSIRAQEGEPATVVVVDGLDESAPLVRVDGFLTAHGRVV
ncbi:hypothetical protein [Nocardia fluminea]|uniref:Uncharacterized protein n=1 Tax=Nocardia fluminea TaxID=134984 RepID=A0A2N3V528_9NOCA|nr:hypothetical protein [Nocardia fluminea]PKV76735.1 hypothetical protein ATK86_7137 [Nocardia fluminea]